MEGTAHLIKPALSPLLPAYMLHVHAHRRRGVQGHVARCYTKQPSALELCGIISNPINLGGTPQQLKHSVIMATAGPTPQRQGSVSSRRACGGARTHMHACGAMILTHHATWLSGCTAASAGAALTQTSLQPMKAACTRARQGCCNCDPHEPAPAHKRCAAYGIQTGHAWIVGRTW